MEKTINVSIGGVAFILESQAYMLLKDYTVKIEGGYRENPDGAEILSDIESRISELILTRQSSEQVVPAALIKEIIEQLGLPDDLSEPKNIKNDDTACGDEEPAYKSSINKRLYRNPEGAKLGGVGSGLGAYFNVDPVWIRLLFFVPLLMIPIFGVLRLKILAGYSAVILSVGVMLYFILWIIIPKAKTPLQKLEMTGTKITVSSIEQKFYDDFSERNPSQKSEKQASVLSEILYILGNIILFCLKALLLLIGIGLGIGAIAIVAAAIIAFSILFGHGPEWLSAPEFATIMILGALFLILPMIVLSWLLIKTVFGLRTHGKTLAIVSGIWMLVLVFMTVFAVRNIENIKTHNFQWLNSDLHLSRSKSERIEMLRKAREEKNIQMLSDTTSVESINMGDSIVMDTIKKEYYTR